MNGLVARLLAAITPNTVITAPYGCAHATMCLTFDDGPHPQVTPAILKALAQAEVTATFFLSGEAGERFPELVRQIDAGGHGIANHGYRHRPVREVAAVDYVADVERCQSRLEEILGRPLPRLFRPPYGVIGATSFRALRDRGYLYVLWNAESHDCDAGTPDDLVEAMRRRELPTRCVLLLHDDYPSTAAALPGVITEIAARGYEFARLDRVVRGGVTSEPASPRGGIAA